MTELSLRTFEIRYETLMLQHGDTLTLASKELEAAYYQQGLGIGEDSGAFVVFKDCQHKPVFAVRASAVVTIEEIRDRDQSDATAMPGMHYNVPAGYTTTFTTGGPALPKQPTRDE